MVMAVTMSAVASQKLAIWRHLPTWHIAIAPWAKTPADDHWRRWGFVGTADVLQQRNRSVVCVGEGGIRVAEPPPPVAARAPGGALKDQPDAVLPGDRCIGTEVAMQRLLPCVRTQEVKGREVWELQALVEDERGLDSAVREKEAAGELWQAPLKA
jgi:hypothetical protein